MALARAIVAAALALLAGCSALLDLHDPEHQPTADGRVVDSPMAIDSPMVDTPPGGYHAAAVRFDPVSGDYMSQAGLLGAPTSSQVGTFSVWLHFNGDDGSAQTIAAAMEIANGGITRNSSNKIVFTLFQCNGAPLLGMETRDAYTSTSGWIHLLAAWDLPNNKGQIYVNGTLETANLSVHSGSICYNAPAWYIGGTNGGSLNADVADFFASFDTFRDLGSPSNVALFRDLTTGKPVDLGPGCSTAGGGTSPIACFIGPVAGWSSNKGTGGGFTLHGDGLAAASSGPSG